jgi:DNA-binding transcriptional ArsR family regulator
MIELLTPGAADLIARRFRALGDPNRLRLLAALNDRGEASVGELAEALEMSQQNVSKHLAALNAEGFLARRKEKTSVLYRIADDGVLELCEQICSGIEAQLTELGALIVPASSRFS